MIAQTVQLVEPAADQQEVLPIEAYRTPIQRWIIRILLDLKGYQHVGAFFNIYATNLTPFLELDLDTEEGLEDAFVPLRLAARLRELEGQPDDHDEVFKANFTSLSQALALTSTEEKVMEFLFLMHKSTELGEVTDLIGTNLTLGDLAMVFAVILRTPQDETHAALSPDGTLFTSGLVRINAGPGALRNKLRILSSLVDAVSTPQNQPLGILARYLDQAPAPRLAPADFADYRAQYGLLKRYLRGALEQRLVGSNILIHGLPGVGKTQLVRTLCTELGAELFEVATQGSEKEPLAAWSRLSIFQLSQQMLAKQVNTVLLFDEIEDVFSHSGTQSVNETGGRDSRKGWFNHQLETNNLPVFWLANDVSQLAPAYIRRFDLVLELRPMRAKARRKLIEQACRRAEVTPGPWISKAAENQHLSPALIEKITRVMAQTRPEEGESEAALFEKLANGTLSVMGLPLLRLAQHTPTLPYAVDILNADTDLEALVPGLENRREARLLCYGPPGTGKTAFAQYLAAALDLPLLQFRASDILDPYIGRTEQKLARAFKQANDAGAIMLLDEIDSLLHSRNNASHSWEVTQVNELLVQMENFRGILLACTNHTGTLDSAAARRFDLKIGFGYMKPEDAWDFFEQVIKAHKVRCGRGKQALKHRVMELRHLTPGDFKTAVRRLSLSADGFNPRDLLEVLEQETQAKGLHDDRPGIGFLAAV